MEETFRRAHPGKPQKELVKLGKMFTDRSSDNLSTHWQGGRSKVLPLPSVPQNVTRRRANESPCRRAELITGHLLSKPRAGEGGRLAAGKGRASGLVTLCSVGAGRVLAGVAVVLLLAAARHVLGAGAQELRGHLETGEIASFSLPDLQQGQVLFIRAESASGDLDPFVVLVKAQASLERIASLLTPAKALATDETIAKRLTAAPVLAWNDDAKGYHSAVLEYRIPATGDYRLIVSSTPVQPTFGDYRLLIGVDTPRVLSGAVQPSGVSLAFADQLLGGSRRSVQALRTTLAKTRERALYQLHPVKAGETLYIFLRGEGGGLAPNLTLVDIGNKALQTAVVTEQGTRATLRHTFEADRRNLALRLSRPRREVDLGEIQARLLVGLDAPEVLTGEAKIGGRAVVREATPVRMGIKMQQITGVDQKQENFGVVVALRMEWQDPALAFDPERCECRWKLFQVNDFRQYVRDQATLWPEFTLANQQGRRWEQTQVVVVFPSGEALYFERFSTTLQAPDFNFRLFPFDSQLFFIRVDSLFPEQYFRFEDLPGFSGVGEQLGEEEWLVTEFSTPISLEQSSTGFTSSRYSFRFEATRHRNYYIIRVFIPLLIILMVSWAIFFLKDYGKRVDFAAGNLLLFIAFNFTIGNDLPRLGYLTLLDMLLVSAFLVTSLVLIISVFLTRAEALGKKALVRTVDPVCDHRLSPWLHGSGGLDCAGV
jgi:hypothetical protein